MTADEARAIAENLNAAADQAEAEGRTELLESDLAAVLSNHASLNELAAAIQSKTGA